MKMKRKLLGALMGLGIAALLNASPLVHAADVIQNGSFDVGMTISGDATIITSGQTFGAWRVAAGSVSLLKPGGKRLLDTTYPFHAVDLAGTSNGTITQVFETRPNHEYEVSFAYAGSFTTNNWDKGIEVKAGNAARTQWVKRDAKWSPATLNWQRLVFTFKATTPETTLQFRSLQGLSPRESMLITDVKVMEGGPPPLNTIPVPLPSQLNLFVKDRNKAVQLGKALFWDMQVGSDGRTACATCHNNAGIDQRTINMLNPGAPGSTFGPQSPEQKRLRDEAIARFVGANRGLAATDFPFHKVANSTGDHKDNQVLRSTPLVTGSQGVVKKDFVAVVPGNPIDEGVLVKDSLFQVDGANARQVTGRNTPTTINAVFFDRLFWDGRANHFFNGRNPFGDLDPNANVFKSANRTRVELVWETITIRIWFFTINIPILKLNTINESVLEPTKILLNNAALASQAVGPALNEVEMSWNGRAFKELGRKMLSVKPLGLQVVHAQDSVLGSVCQTGGTGLRTNYAQMIREAFVDQWWNGTVPDPENFTHMESNFSLFWGLSLMMYQSTLVSDQTPYDSFAAGNSTALSDSAKRGMRIYFNEGKCVNCHGGPEFAGATISDIRSGTTPKLIELMAMGDGKPAWYDNGFYNIGVRPTLEDIAVGASHPQFGPLSYTVQRQKGRNIGQSATVTGRIAVNGAFKTSTLRNIELTGPYFHNGGARTLRESVEFYVRGADFHRQNIDDLDPDVDGIKELQGDDQAIDDLVSFLKALTDERVRFQRAPFDHPELIVPNGHTGSTDGVAIDNLIRLPAVGAGGGQKVLPFEEIVK